MRLVELSPAERDYFNSPLPSADTLSPLFARHLGRLLAARMRHPVQVIGLSAGPVVSPCLEAREAPAFEWDPALAMMWHHARLGRPGCSVQRPAAALTHNLLRTLQACLAETWRSLPDAQSLPPVLSLRIDSTPAQATPPRALLTILLPSSAARMQQWAQRIIRDAP
mgnify:CR=1 FL=1